DRTAHADRVNARRGGQGSDRHRDVIAAATADDDIGEQKSASLVFAQPTLELPAHQRLQLAILVDGAIHAPEHAFGFEALRMLLKVARSPARFGGRRLACALFEHKDYLLFWCSAMIGRATRKQSTPVGAPQ